MLVCWSLRLHADPLQAQEAKRKALESDTGAASLARVREAVAGADQDGDDVITVTELEEAGMHRLNTVTAQYSVSLSLV